MEGARARRLLKSLSIKQGLKFDAPESAAEIPAFIAFHKLKLEEVRDPLESFKTFNQFFYRKLKEDARPVTDPFDPTTLVSAADCRLMTFDTVADAQKFWIKGREFTVARLLGDAYKDEAHKYTGGALAVFRLAPQDYHRFHSPVDGTIGPMSDISGEYYTVNVSKFSIESAGVCANRAPTASSYPHDTRRIRRKCTQDCADRQPGLWSCHGGLRRRHDGGQHPHDRRHPRHRGSRPGVRVFRLRRINYCLSV